MEHGLSDQRNWQESKSTVHERISYLYMNKSMSDFTLVSCGVRFPVHKIILASASSVFHSMFYGSIPEKKQELDLTEYGDPECISEFLKVIYTDNISLNWEIVFKILNLAEFYMISSLSKKCTKFVRKTLTVENVLKALQPAILFEKMEILEKCLEIVKQYTSRVIKQDSFLELDLRSVKEILKQEVLYVKEIDLFLAVDKWCENQLTKDGKEVSCTSKRELLGDALHLIRFPIMSLTDFGKHCVKSQLLTHEETNNLVHYLSQDDREQTVTEISSFTCSVRHKSISISLSSANSVESSIASIITKTGNKRMRHKDNAYKKRQRFQWNY